MGGLFGGFSGIGAGVGQAMSPFMPQDPRITGLSGNSGATQIAAAGVRPGFGQLLWGALQSPQIQALLQRGQGQQQFSFPAAPGLLMPRAGAPFQLPQLTALGGLFGGVGGGGYA